MDEKLKFSGVDIDSAAMGLFSSLTQFNLEIPPPWVKLNKLDIYSRILVKNRTNVEIKLAL